MASASGVWKNWKGGTCERGTPIGLQSYWGSSGVLGPYVPSTMALTRAAYSALYLGCVGRNTSPLKVYPSGSFLAYCPPPKSYKSEPSAALLVRSLRGLIQYPLRSGCPSLVRGVVLPSTEQPMHGSLGEGLAASFALSGFPIFLLAWEVVGAPFWEATGTETRSDSAARAVAAV